MDQAAFVAATGDKLESEIRRLEALLEGWFECHGPVSVTTAVPEDEPVTFFLNTFEFPEWSPLVMRDSVPGLYVQPGYVITKWRHLRGHCERAILVPREGGRVRHGVTHRADLDRLASRSQPGRAVP